MSRLPPFDFKSVVHEQAAAKVAKPANIEAAGAGRLATLAPLAGTSRRSAVFETRPREARTKPTPAVSPGWTFEDWRYHFEERAAIREYDGGLSRPEAEAGAFADCVARWRALNPLPASESRTCVHCRRDYADTPVLARGGHAWLHGSCWEPMNAARDEVARQAVTALLAAIAQGTAASALKGDSP